MGRIKLILAATALMVAMLAATAVPAMADEWDDRHFGPFHHDRDDFEEVDVDVDVVNLGRDVDCFVVTFEEEDDHGDEEEDVEFFCVRDTFPFG